MNSIAPTLPNTEILELNAHFAGDSAFFTLSQTRVNTQVQTFQSHFAGQALYAVKSNPHPALLQAIYTAGLRHFDVASVDEIERVKALGPDVVCFFMNPVKSRQSIASAYHTHGIRHFSLDSLEELDKMQAVLGEVTDLILFVRLKTLPGKAVINLSEKFGADEQTALALIARIQASGQQLGLTFHVGSQCLAIEDYTRNLQIVEQLMEKAGLTQLAYLDVSGGFPVDYQTTESVPALENYLRVISQAVEQSPKLRDAQLFCEPGRAICAPSMQLFVPVLLRRDNVLTVGDGVYQNLSEFLISRISLPVAGVHLQANKQGELRQPEAQQAFTIYGQTCDSYDQLPEPLMLPNHITEGDWIVFSQAGAYTLAVATAFNGFPAAEVVSVDSLF